MRARIALAPVFAAALAGCGGHSNHAAISDYIQRVDALEGSMSRPLGEVSQANRSFANAQTHPNPAVTLQLKRSVRTLRRLRSRFAEIDAPPAALRLRAVLLQLIGREVALAEEVQQIAQFVPAYRAALAPLGAQDAQLKRTLARTTKGAAATKALDAEKADALSSYAGLVSFVTAKLKLLSPPSVWRPAYETQLASLAALRSSASALADAVRAHRAAAIPALLRRFDAAAIATQSVSAQRAQIAAVRSYDAQIRRIATLAARAQAERTRLQKA